MARLGGLVLFGAAAAGGYLAGRHEHRLLSTLDGVLQRRQEQIERPSSRPCYDTEFDHVAESEMAERHRIAEEIRRHPLRERASTLSEDEVDAVASKPLKRDVDEYRYPKSY